MKRKDVDEVTDDFFDFTLSSPAQKIRRLDAELAPMIDEEEMVNPEVFGQSVPFQDTFFEQSVGTSPIAIDELSSGVPGNEERAIVLFNPQNYKHPLPSPRQFSISADSDFLSGFKNPVLWSNWWNAPKPSVGEAQKQDDNSGLSNGCLAVVPWVPSHSQKPPTPEVEAPDAQVSEMMDVDAMDTCNTQQIPRDGYGATSVSEGLNQWQQALHDSTASQQLGNPNHLVW